MEPMRSKLRYLLDWTDRDKCLLLAVLANILESGFWVMLVYVAHYTDFGQQYFASNGLDIVNATFSGGLVIWAFLLGWGGWLRHRQKDPAIYTTTFLYLMLFPLISKMYLIGIFSSVPGVVFIGLGLTGSILFSFKRMIGPSLFVSALLLVLAYLTGSAQIEYAPLFSMLPITKEHVPGAWLGMTTFIVVPYVICIFALMYLLITRWNEREGQVRRLSNTDTLTGLPNRRSAYECMDSAVQEARDTAVPLAIIMMDLDHFKRVNDKWGHAAGDQVLKQVGQILKAQLRYNDLIGRVGGEEFLMLLPNTSRQDASAIVDRCRLAIANHRVALPDGKDIRITGSFGIHAVSDTRDETRFIDLIRLADKALYAAKENGRNRVEFV